MGTTGGGGNIIPGVSKYRNGVDVYVDSHLSKSSRRDKQPKKQDVVFRGVCKLLELAADSSCEKDNLILTFLRIVAPRTITGCLTPVTMR